MDIKNQVAEILKIANEQFYRLPDHVVHTDVYRFKANIISFCDKLLHGDDYDMIQAKNLINKFNDINSQAKAFKTKEDVDQKYK